MLSYPANLLKLARQDRHLNPQVVIYYVTGQCNLNCTYCEDFGARRNPENPSPLPLEQAKHILRVIRSGCDALWLTGGEPLTHPQIDELAAYARRELKFREISLISNGFLLPAHEDLLRNIDRLIVSLDSTDPQAWSQTIGITPASAAQILENITWAAKRQKQDNFSMVANMVITPETLPQAERVLEFCIQNNLLLSVSPQSVNNWPHYTLTVSPEYRDFIQKLIELKKQNAPILGSMAYLKKLQRFEPYDCYPTLVPRIYPNGELAYPCRPLEKAGNGQGGRPVNLMQVQTWDEAWSTAYATYGQPPRTCHSCFQQCYAESSLMQAQPLSMLWESIRYPASRKGKILTLAPG